MIFITKRPFYIKLLWDLGNSLQFGLYFVKVTFIPKSTEVGLSN